MKPAHQTFLLELLTNGDRFRAYKAAYPTAEGEALRTAANRLMRHPAIAEKLTQVQASAQQQLQEKLNTAAEKQTCELVTLHEKRLLLARMMRGHYKQVKYICLKDAIHEVEADITPAALLRAIELDCKLASGKYKDMALPKQEVKSASLPKPVPIQQPAPSPIPQPIPEPTPPVIEENKDAFSYIPKHVTLIYPHEQGSIPKPPSTPPTVSEQNWQQYLKLDANLRRSAPTVQSIRKAVFERLPLKQQQLILRPLITCNELLKKTPAMPLRA